MRDPRVLPLTSATVTVGGATFGPRSIIWAGLMWDEAEPMDDGLRVPWCHPNDRRVGPALAVYRVRPRDERFRLERARNGLSVLREAVDA